MSLIVVKVEQLEKRVEQLASRAHDVNIQLAALTGVGGANGTVGNLRSSQAEILRDLRTAREEIATLQSHDHVAIKKKLESLAVSRAVLVGAALASGGAGAAVVKFLMG